MTDEKLQGLMKEWVDRLGLQNWTIKLLTHQRPEDMTEKDTAGCVDYSECNRAARIELLGPEFYGNCVADYDEEKTLVHELLHLMMSLFFDGDALLERVAHMILDDLAKALVAAKRDGNRKQPERLCGTCKDVLTGVEDEPCKSCDKKSNWTPKGQQP